MSTEATPPRTPQGTSAGAGGASSVSPKRALKPISPHKNNNVTVGKLNFLQNDNIDFHFDRIHGCNDEILESLHSLEHSTQQTKVDLEQLFDRSKNNNQNLNKLLENIAEYSKEVTEEGNATKTDVGKIMSVLHELKESQKIDSLVAHYDSKQKESVKEIGKMVDSFLSSTKPVSTELIQQLNNIEQKVNGLKQVGDQNDFNRKLQLSLDELTRNISGRSDELSPMLRELSTLIDSRKYSGKENHSYGSDMDANIVHLKKMVEAQAEALHQLTAAVKSSNHTNNDEKRDLEKSYNELQEKYTTLNTSYTQLESRYSKLEAHYARLESNYEARYQALIALEAKFTEVQDESQALESRMANLDLSKYDRVQQLHSGRVSELWKDNPLLNKKRVISMPSRNNIPENDDEF